MTTIVYLVKPGDHNEELRYSLRSLVNLPHDRVVIVGYKPVWVQGVEVIDGNAHGTKWLNVFDNLRLACQADDEFVVMNDDIYVMHPLTEAPSWSRGGLVEHLARVRSGPWRTSLERTLDRLRELGIQRPVSYEIHSPVLVNAARLEAVLAPVAEGLNPPQWRTLYGNVYAVPSTEVRDCKIMRATSVFDPSWPVVSSDDSTWRTHRGCAAIRAAFTAPSPYEAAAWR